MSLVQIQAGLPTMKGINMSEGNFIISLLAVIGYCEFMWFCRQNFSINVIAIVKTIMYLNGLAILFGSNIASFIGFYFNSLYVIVIYKDRLRELDNELQQNS